MANYSILKAAIQAVIKQNGNNEITGALLQAQLLSMINSLGANYQFAGIATPAANPGTPDQNVFYLASTAGTYANFGGLVLADGEVAVLKYNGSWSKDLTGVAQASSIRQNYIVAYTAGLVDITTDRVFTISDGNLVCRVGNNNYIIESGSTFTLSNITAYDSFLWAIIFDTDNLQLIAKRWSSTVPTDKIIACVSVNSNNQMSMVHCVVPFRLNGRYFDDKQAEEIREIAYSYSLLSPYMWQRIKPHNTHYGNGTYGPDRTRNAMDVPAVFDEDITITVQPGYKFAVQYFDGPETGETHMIQALPWITSTHVVPANTYFCLIVANVRDTATTQRETESLSFFNTRYGNAEMFKTLEQIKEVVSPDNGINYDGEKIQMRLFHVENFKTLINATWAQSMAIYNNYVIFFNNENQTAKLFSIETGQLLGTLSIPNGGYYNPHCNVACVGNEFASANSIMPVIYVSQWDAGHERACFVYDVQSNNGVYSLTLVQKINLSGVSSNIIGSGECDFVVDRDNNEIYAFAYKTSVNTNYGTATMICKFALPLLSDGTEILITDSDIAENFEMALVKYRQDAFFNNGRIYLANGGLDDVKAHISIIDVEQKKIVTNVPIYKYLDGEPECLDMYGQTKILFNYGTGLLNLRY